jgi:hypothetical protein
VAGNNITEDIPLNVGNPGTLGFWVNNAEEYDVAVGGYPFLLAPTDNNPYQRETAQYRKDQFDSSKEPGEQSLTGWWLRSQSSFHNGTGIKFFDPTGGESIPYRFADSQGVNVWTKGQISLLNSTSEAHVTTGAIRTNKRPFQTMRSIQWGGVNAVLLHDEYDVDKIAQPITVSITNKALTSNVATLTTSAAHGLAVGLTIVVTGVDATFNGTYVIASVPTTTTFTYAKTASNVTSAAVSPAGAGVTDEVVHFIDYNSGSAEPVYAICDDGTNAYWLANHVGSGANKLHMFKKPLTGNSTTGETLPSLTGDIIKMFDATGVVITNAVMDFVKDRIIACINNAVYEIAPNATALSGSGGTLVYTNPNSSYIYTSVTASGSAVYTAGYSGMYSSIQKYVLKTDGAMPVLAQATTAAEFPPGEIVYKIMHYLGYMLIGTNKGVRVATVNDQYGGTITYGPLIVETAQPVYDFAARDRFVWATTGVGVDAGLIRIDLSGNIEGETLRFPYANDLQYAHASTNITTAVSFIGETNKLSFCTAYSPTNGHVYLESPTILYNSGYLTTGFIRYSTLEPKNFKFIRGRGDFTNGSMDITSIDESGNTYNIISYNSVIGNPEAATTQPEGSQEYISFKFTFSRNQTDTNLGPLFKGYQVKALPATERSRLISFPVWCYDVETDRNSVQIGYEGRAWERIQNFESLEKLGDIVNVQDFTTGERVQAIIEKTNFVRRTPPSGKFSGFGGLFTIIVRTVL